MGSAMRLAEQNAEQQQKTIDGLEKTREQQRRAAVDSAAKVTGAQTYIADFAPAPPVSHCDWAHSMGP